MYPKVNLKNNNKITFVYTSKSVIKFLNYQFLSPLARKGLLELFVHPHPKAQAVKQVSLYPITGGRNYHRARRSYAIKSLLLQAGLSQRTFKL